MLIKKSSHIHLSGSIKLNIINRKGQDIMWSFAFDNDYEDFESGNVDYSSQYDSEGSWRDYDED